MSRRYQRYKFEEIAPRTGWDRSSEVMSDQDRKGKEKSDQFRTVMISLDQLGQVRTGKVRQVIIGQEALPELAKAINKELPVLTQETKIFICELAQETKKNITWGDSGKYRVSQKKRYLKSKTRNVFHRELTLGNERKCLW